MKSDAKKKRLVRTKRFFLVFAIVFMSVAVGVVIYSTLVPKTPDDTLSYDFEIPETQNDSVLVLETPGGDIQVIRQETGMHILFQAKLINLIISDNGNNGIVNVFDSYTFMNEEFVYGNNLYLDAIVKKLHISMGKTIRYDSRSIGVIDIGLLDSIDVFKEDSKLHFKNDVTAKFQKAWAVFIVSLQTKFVQTTFLLLVCFSFISAIIVVRCNQKIERI